MVAVAVMHTTPACHLEVKSSLGSAAFSRRSGFIRQGTRLRSIHLSVNARGSPGTGGNVIDRPTTSPDTTKRRETKRRKPPSYRVLLHNDNVNKREYVVQVLLRVVEGYTVEDALNVMQEAHFNGLALVTVTNQDQAMDYCEGMRNSGLIATIEPAGPNGV